MNTIKEWADFYVGKNDRGPSLVTIFEKTPFGITKTIHMGK